MDDDHRTSPRMPPTSRRLHRLAMLLLLLALAPPAMAAEPIRVGIYQNPPKLFRDENGQAAGFFVDILEEIGRREQWQFNYVDCIWEECLQRLERGELDLMPDVAYSAGREQRFDFQREVVLYNWSLLYARHRDAFHSLPELDGQRIAVISDSIQYAILKRLLQGTDSRPHFLELDGSQAVMQAVVDGRADAALVNRLYGLQYAEGFGLVPTHLLVESSRIHFASGEGRNATLLQAIDRQLGAMKADSGSVYYRAMHRWIEPLDEPDLPPGLLWLTAAIIAVLLAFAFHNRILKRAVHDATGELKKRNSALFESETMFRSLFDNAADAMLLTSNARVIKVNPSLLRLFGYPDLESIKELKRSDFFPPQQANGEASDEGFQNHVMQAFASGHDFFEWTYRRADGSTFTAEVSLLPMQISGRPVIQTTIRDISQRKQSQEQLQRLNRALKTLSSVNHTLVNSLNEDELLDKICRIIVVEGGYLLAWVGLAIGKEACPIAPAAQFGVLDDTLSERCTTCTPERLDQCPSCNTIQSDKPIVVHDILNDPRFSSLHEQATLCGYNSLITLPLISGKSAFGVLNIYSNQTNAFSAEERQLLQELADDLAFGIQTQRMRIEQAHIEEERQDHQRLLQDAMLKTIQAITAMVEMRDPYTAGHQSRVAHLAVAVGEELGLDPVRIEGLRFGAQIHDIGNIYVPAEILNHPGRLSTAEQIIVHSHVEVGYEIVKDIDFPWPIADMILHHHERMDGSGYPNGLKGDEISLESQIIAVADITEAMLSHRPYRAAVGVERTFNELRENRGIKYDPQVVDATLHLFEEKGYSFPEYGGRNLSL